MGSFPPHDAVRRPHTSSYKLPWVVLASCLFALTQCSSSSTTGPAASSDSGVAPLDASGPSDAFGPDTTSPFDGSSDTGGPIDSGMDVVDVCVPKTMSQVCGSIS